MTSTYHMSHVPHLIHSVRTNQSLWCYVVVVAIASFPDPGPLSFQGTERWTLLSLRSIVLRGSPTNLNGKDHKPDHQGQRRPEDAVDYSGKTDYVQ